jgi:hypothetical protein
MSLAEAKRAPTLAPVAPRRCMARSAATAQVREASLHPAPSEGRVPPIACWVRACRVVSPSGHHSSAGAVL